MVSTSPPTQTPDLLAQVSALVHGANTLGNLLRTQVSLANSPLAPFVERGFFASNTTFGGQNATLLDRFPVWFRNRACEIEAELSLRLAKLYADLLVRFDLSGPVPVALSAQRLTSESQELEILIRLDDLGDLARALAPLYAGIVEVDALANHGAEREAPQAPM